jgi:prepilin-type N-terminal cleavage/methylation domain-containing protein
MNGERNPSPLAAQRSAVVVGESGFSLIEVLFAMVIVAFVVVGVMGAFQCADFGMRYGMNGTKALAMAEAKLEMKRAGSWGTILSDDIDGDGKPETLMHDDGQSPDVIAGDGTYSGERVEDGMHLIWSVQPVPSGPLETAGAVLLESRALYRVASNQWKEVRLGTMRTNPRYVGHR